MKTAIGCGIIASVVFGVGALVDHFTGYPNIPQLQITAHDTIMCAYGVLTTAYLMRPRSQPSPA